MSPKRPVIGLPADRRMIGLHPFHAVGEKYLRAIAEAAGCVPLLIPALGDIVPVEEVLEIVDGLVFTGSPSNVEPTHYSGTPSLPGTLHDAAHDSRRSRARHSGARHLSRLPGNERGLRWHAPSAAARSAGLPRSPGR